MKNKWKNYGLWASIFAFIPLLLESINFYGFDIELPGNYEVLVKALLGILVIAGVLSNPSQGKLFKDE